MIAFAAVLGITTGLASGYIYGCWWLTHRMVDAIAQADTEE